MGLLSMLGLRPARDEFEIDAAVIAADHGYVYDWRPESDDITVAPAYLMDDDGCAGDQAHGAQFWLNSAPGASLTIWAYAAAGGPRTGDYYFVGYKIAYSVLSGRGYEEWSAALYCGDVTFAEWYNGPRLATEAAREAAADLARNGAAAAALHVPAETITAWFDWDGTPW
jgi:hypothetical protein